MSFRTMGTFRTGSMFARVAASKGLYTLTESDLHKDLRGNGFRGPLLSESVAIGVYGIDAHRVQGPDSRQEPGVRKRCSRRHAASP